MKKHEEEKEPNHERWLLTYSDLITLLMIFFVIMYASSNVDIAKYKAISDSFRSVMGQGGPTKGDNIISSDTPIVVEPEKPTGENEGAGDGKSAEALKLESLKNTVDKYLAENGMAGSVSTIIEERGLVISLNDTIIFDVAKAQIRDNSKAKLINLGRILNSMNNYVRVEGHTDNVPISNWEFKSNWQLSVIRATNVTEMLIAESGIPPQRIAAVGYGEYRPVTDNNTEVGRARNRRVDIIVLDSKYNQVENNKKQ